MTVSKLNPWNWFKKEREQEKTLPVKHMEREARTPASPLDQFHTDFDRLVESMFQGFGLPARRLLDMHGSGLEDVAVKPKVDIYGTDKQYVIEADLPGVDEKDIAIELRDDTLVLTAEKRKEEKTEDKGYYRMERSYGSFRRLFDIPHDADREAIGARFNDGVLCITMPRTQAVDSGSRKIPIEGARA